jgi:hypothetical protein
MLLCLPAGRFFKFAYFKLAYDSLAVQWGKTSKKKTGHYNSLKKKKKQATISCDYNSCSPTLQLSNVSACARPRRTVSDLAAADGVAKLYGQKEVLKLDHVYFVTVYNGNGLHDRVYIDVLLYSCNPRVAAVLRGSLAVVVIFGFADAPTRLGKLDPIHVAERQRQLRHVKAARLPPVLRVIVHAAHQRARRGVGVVHQRARAQRVALDAPAQLLMHVLRQRAVVAGHGACALEARKVEARRGP